jgi:hypothetical protein
MPACSHTQAAKMEHPLYNSRNSPSSPSPIVREGLRRRLTPPDLPIFVTPNLRPLGDTGGDGDDES